MSKNRLQSEAGHFDRVYEKQRGEEVSPVTEANLARYSRCAEAHLYGTERLFDLAKPLENRDVLEMGCGVGKNSICLAANGARVWAYDVSQQAIQTAREKARLNGLDSRITFAVASSAQEAFGDKKFDVVFGNLILHHLDFGSFPHLLQPLLAPGGKCVFREPVIRSKILGQLRKLIPWYPSNPSPDEKPLTDDDVAILARPFAKCEVYYYEAMSRLWGRFRRWSGIVRDLHTFDARVFRLWPGAAILASCAVFSLSDLREPGNDR